MGTVIRSTFVSMDKNIHSSIEHATCAARECISGAGIDKDDIQLIINTGVYRDHNIVEPAIAALIQQRLGINPEFKNGKKTFGFDLINGSCGFLNAAQIVKSMFDNGDIRYALVVSGDVHPSKQETEEFPFTHSGSAVLFENTGDEKGFQDFMFRTTQDIYEGFKSVVDVRIYGSQGRGNIAFDIDKDYPDHLAAFTGESLQRFYDENSRLREIDRAAVKLVTSQPVKGFGEKILAGAGIDSISAICVHDKYGDSHSSSLPLAYHEGRENGFIGDDNRIMFVGAGAGLTVGLGYYIS
ncbi:MAG: hypothetical protein CVV44_21730 [Spirochaetae bacterium HGW-Spirochaetae-1]|nr:MAG: hypothetical protein CVV44_21730 [Spirochaetae bacterium HGW-Spirochaetae-1]